MGFSGGSGSKESACNVGDLGSIPGLGRSLGGGHGNPAQCLCLENPVNRGAWCVRSLDSLNDSSTSCTVRPYESLQTPNAPQG